MATCTPPPKHEAPRPPSYAACDLVGPEGQALITLDTQVYTLRITRAGKLILTK
ncbi:MAG: hemin uptake protein HemP [Roseovarius sp.]